MKTKNLLVVMAIIIMAFMLVGCDINNSNVNNQNDNSGNVTSNNTSNLEDDDKKITDGIIKLELYPNIAPESVENFIELANSGFYNGLTFHRTIPGFMAQGGDPEGNGTGGPDYSIYGEFSFNGFANSLSHERGVLSMARSQENNSAGSQFFIMVADADYLDGNYAAFGKVLEGMDVVDEVVNTEVIRREMDAALLQKIMSGANIDNATIEEYYKQQMELDRPKNPPVIKSVTVETFGVTYGSPFKITEANSGDLSGLTSKDANRYAEVTQNPIVTIEIQK